MGSLHIALWLKLLIAAAVGMFAFCAAVPSVRLVRRKSEALRRRLAPNGWLDLALLVAFAACFARDAATKGTNDPPRGASVELRVKSVELWSKQSYNSTLSTLNTQLPFRLESVTINDSYSYAMPANGIRYDRWWNHGAYI